MKRAVKSGTLRFIFIALVFMLLIDQFVFGGKRAFIENAKTIEKQEEALAAPKPPPSRVQPPEGAYFEEAPERPVQEGPSPEQTAQEQPAPPNLAIAPPKTLMPPGIVPEIAPGAAQPPPEIIPPTRNGAKIAIIIDDLGMDVKHTKEVLDLPAPITLAFLPYAPQTRVLAARGKAQGHELIIHTPMEAVDAKLNIGPGGLTSGMSAAELDAAFGAMLKSFDGYVGINNHMGSRLTQDRAKMDALMAMLSKRGLFFVDSKTTAQSVAAQEAASAGVRYAERDVFLDHVETRAFVDKALAQAERIAAKKGHAIAIGHPKAFTIAGLQAWIPSLAAKGIELVPVSELLMTPTARQEETAVPVQAPETLPTAVPEAAPQEIAPPAQESETLAPSVDMFPEEQGQGLY